MNSSRTKTKRETVYLRVILLTLMGSALQSGGTWGHISAEERVLKPEDVRAAVTRHLNMTYVMPEYRTREEWLARRDSLRRQIMVAAGLWPIPDKCPLKPQVFDRLERDGYSIEKVYFESYPGFLVTGNLYRPLGKKPPFPGVLAPHGHWTYGRLENSATCSVPARCITLARQGYVVFSYDMVGYNDSRQVRHRFVGDREALWGFTSLGLHLWNSIRSVDFLESIPDVDKTRLACTGASGGGTQTFLLAAVDERIAVTAPVNMISAHMQGGDVCENAPNLRVDTNNMEIAALTAPRPMIMVSATGDWTKNTMEVEFPAVQSIYRLLNAEDKLTAVQVKADHNYNRESREHVYRWFGRWLLDLHDPEVLREKDLHLDPTSEMLVFYGRPLPATARSEQEILEDFIASAAARIDTLKPGDEPGLAAYREAFGTAFQFSLMAEYPQGNSIQVFGSQLDEQRRYRVKRFRLGRQGKSDLVPVTFWLPGGKMQSRRGILLVHPGGAQRFEQAGEPGRIVDALLKKGCSVLIPDVFNTGTAAFQRQEQTSFFTTYNRTDDANRVQDVLTSLAYLRAEAASQPVRVAGFNSAGLWCLLARAYVRDDTPFAVDLNQFDAASDGSFLTGLNIPILRRAGDLRTACIMNTQGLLWAHNASPTFPSDWVRSVYRSLGKAGLLRIDGESADDSRLVEWLAQGL